ncbi:hydantoinase B/oxoprolinase family protein [Rubrobacter marinus]|uniref:Hydantoinase B/oxoprolinase family protein n=1 Tax=Rubrobacter marinus TaxID=2653852 RepID=A0A6G8Q114_9ACTN|nr:hydantoinase B/oxoprolinase family protein [Rubrobacter marinus]QIN80100.1 hydantoinase B/oxoprolinase family protein [Rubrobacter marinus]
MQGRKAKIDPVTAQVIGGALENVAIEMGHKLARMSYSSIIRESEDFGAALLDAQGRQLCESVDSTPLQLGPIPGYMRGIFRVMEERGETFAPGDVVMHNSPYHGASHGPDVGFCVPVFRGEELIGFSFTTAHHLDIGSLHPGSTGIVDAVDAYAEGLQFKAVKVYDAGKKNEAVWQILRDNIRAPGMVVGDMEAQIAACRAGAERFVEIVEEFGLEGVNAASEELMDYSERMLRSRIAELPDGVYRAEGFIDGFVDSPNENEKDLKIAVTLSVEGSDIHVDFEGTAPQVDLPINMPFEGTVDVAVYLTIRSILLDSALTEYVPQNDGLTRPVRITAPKGTLTNPIFPAPTIARFCPGNIVADTVMRALSEVAPRNVSAGVGNLKVVAYSGLVGEDYWVYMDITEGSYGGRYGKDGMDAVDTLFANTRNNPVEDIESHYPLRVDRYELRDDVASGPGRWRGGLGSIRQISFLEEGRFALEGDGHRFAPWGIFGGEEGIAGDLLLNPGTDGEQHLPSKIPDRRMRAGETVRTVSPCGGGYGDPLQRDPARVLDDVLDGFVSEENARKQYGVVLSDGGVDAAATASLRERMAGERA